MLSLNLFAKTEKKVWVKAEISNNKLAITYKNEKKWHTYWKNPGDAGLPITTKFFIDKEKIKLEELEWPTPKRYIENGDMKAIGYDGEYTLFYNLGKNFFKGSVGKTFTIKSNWLVCKNICIPGKVEINGIIQTAKINFKNNASIQTSGDILSTRLQALPKKTEIPNYLNLKLVSNKSKSGVNIYYTIPDISSSKLSKDSDTLIPFPNEVLSFKRESFKPNEGGLLFKMNADWDGDYLEPVYPFPTEEKLNTPLKLRFLYMDPNKPGQAFVFEKVFKEITLDKSDQFNNLYTALGTDDKSSSKSDTNNSDKKESLLYYLIFAFIGGIILNFMPCVLPIISIKLFGLIKHQGESKKKILLHNVFYSAGVLITFLVLSAVVITLKSAGESVGWGFQLQSPKFIIFIIGVLFIFALNLFGLFEFRTPGGSKIGGIRPEEGPFGDFISGILATILSTPCSAPFLGTALTFAFTSGPIHIILIFTSIGIGLSLPFLITGFFPNLVNFIPRPGKWMEDLKKFLGLTMILTIIWLLDVFSAQVTSSFHMLKLNAGLAFLFFAFYFSHKISKRIYLRLAFFVIPSFFFGDLLISDITDQKQARKVQASEMEKHGLKWVKWSPKKLEEMKLKKDLVFIDFTAKWCFTCKINERVVINTDKFKNLSQKYNLKLLLADWTKRDPIIGNWLKDHGHVGVPAYFIQTKSGQLISLGETITISEIENAIKKSL